MLTDFSTEKVETFLLDFFFLLLKKKNHYFSFVEVIELNNFQNTGYEKIKLYTSDLQTSPGVYRMLDVKGEVLYVGKAKNLKNRVLSYTRSKGHSSRILKMIELTNKMVFLITETETEALLLEQNLIKQLKPKFNVIFRDDKSFPDIFISTEHDFPQIKKFRGNRKETGKYFGPFASVSAVNRTLNYLQRVFLLRNCNDSVFNSRSRPCLLFQIKRCSGPCVGKIGEKEYRKLVNESIDFLSGKKSDLNKELVEKMMKASENLNFELAASLRDRIKALSHIQSNQIINPYFLKEADIIALCKIENSFCIQVFFFRANQNWGNKAFFPSSGLEANEQEILESFIIQFYRKNIAPKQLIISHDLENIKLIEEALFKLSEKRVKIFKPKKGEKKIILDNALKNAKQELLRKISEKQNNASMLMELSKILKLKKEISRIEVYDNSHNHGSFPIGAMIAFCKEGFVKSHYRKFNIKDKSISPGDDFGMMSHVLERRLVNSLKDEKNFSNLPDLILIDGGKGQISSVSKILSKLKIENIMILGIAKTVSRNAGMERFYKSDGSFFTLNKNEKILFFLQRLRDEAHRFAIGTHRAKRKKSIEKSFLDEIDGIGLNRKKALLMHFGSAKAVGKAGISDLKNVEGISGSLAEKIYNFYH